LPYLGSSNNVSRIYLVEGKAVPRREPQNCREQFWGSTGRHSPQKCAAFVIYHINARPTHGNGIREGMLVLGSGGITSQSRHKAKQAACNVAAAYGSGLCRG